MKRYGDNLPSSGIPEQDVEYQHGRNVSAMYGSCTVRSGTFSKPIEYSKKHKTLDILSLLGFRRNKIKQKRA